MGLLLFLDRIISFEYQYLKSFNYVQTIELWFV